MTDYSSVSEDVLGFVVKQALGEADQATMVLKNTNNEYDALAPYTVFNILYGTAPLFSGRIDKPTPRVSMKPGTATQVMDVIGRNHARNLFGIAIDENFPYQEALDIVETMISDCPLITYTAGSSGISMSIPAKLGFVGGYLQYILNERLGRDYYVDTDGLLNEFEIGTLATGITLSLADGGNILDFIWDKNDITEVENYIILKGGKLDDHWSEGNASDWDTNATSVTDESELTSMGVQSLKCTIGAVADPYIELDIYNGGDGLYSYDSLDFSGVVNGELNFDVLLSSDPDIALFGQIYVSLFDENGSVINHTYGSNMLSNLYGNFSGISLPIGPGTTINVSSLVAHGQWWYSNYVDKFTWNVRKIRIGLVGWDSISRPDTFIVDNLAMPVLVRSIAQDATSQTAYGLVMHPEDVNLGSQVEMDSSSTATLAEKKDPIKLATILARGSAGIDGSTNNWKIGGTFTLNNTLEGITAESWRILSLIHRYDPNNPIDGHSYTVELTAVPNTQKTGINRLQSLNNSSYFLKELRSQIAALEQREAINVARPPALPASLNDLYLLSDAQWLEFWQVDQYPFTMEGGATREADADAIDEFSVLKEKTDATGDVVISAALGVPSKAYGTYTFHARMKIDVKPGSSTKICDILVRDDTDSISYTTQIDTGDFSANNTYNFFSVQGQIDPSHDIKFKVTGFVQSVADLSVDWVGVTTFDIPYETLVIAVDPDDPTTIDEHDGTDVDEHSGTDVDKHDGTDVDPHANADVTDAGDRNVEDAAVGTSDSITVGTSNTLLHTGTTINAHTEEVWVQVKMYPTNLPENVWRSLDVVVQEDDDNEYFPRAAGVSAQMYMNYIEHTFLFCIPMDMYVNNIKVYAKCGSSTNFRFRIMQWAHAKHTHGFTEADNHIPTDPDDHVPTDPINHIPTDPDDHSLGQPTFTGATDKHKHGLG